MITNQGLDEINKRLKETPEWNHLVAERSKEEGYSTEWHEGKTDEGQGRNIEMETRKGVLRFPGGRSVEYESGPLVVLERCKQKSYPPETDTYDKLWFEGKSGDEIKSTLADRHGIPLWRIEEILEVWSKYLPENTTPCYSFWE